MRFQFILFFVIILVSCNTNKTHEQVKTVATEDLVFYSPSEMAKLMEEMYVYNENLKEKILSNGDLGKFNTKFESIHSAQLKETFERDALFENLSQARAD